jgi:mandelamide amidase
LLPEEGTAIGGPLGGQKFGVKSNVAIGGLPYTAGVVALAGNVPSRDADVVLRLRMAGAQLVGQTAMHELGLGVIGLSSDARPVVLPGHPERSAGGSSSGSAVAVAVGDVDFAIGTDTGGSARIPAAFCGIAGFRPTSGRYSHDGVALVSSTRDTIGLLARTVGQLAQVDAVLAGTDSGPAPGIALRLGVPRTEMYADADDDVASAVESALDALRAGGHTLVDMELGQPRAQMFEIGSVILTYEIEQLLPLFFTQPDLPVPDLHAAARLVGTDDVRQALEAIAAKPTSEATYRHALARRADFITRYCREVEHHRVDALVFPTVLTTAPVHSERLPEAARPAPAEQLRKLVANTTLATVVGSPSVSVPCGSTTTGLNVGLLVDGVPGGDRWTLGVAGLVESAIRPSGPIL